MDCSTGGKLPHHGPRRFAVPAQVFRGDYVTDNNNFSVTKSECSLYFLVSCLFQKPNGHPDQSERHYFFANIGRSYFEHHWDKYMHLDMGLPHYEFIYPVVPQQPLDNTSLLTSVFSSKDIPNIRIKIANDLIFHPKNSGMQHRVTEYKQQDV
ncbi:hypothetical protein C2845_PM07G02820 [Panicum miliaceum]|uniref:Uncharacterized protein n=1 Tax=Panicum miliaceum TaxID=4540 RepID=A0A3L6SU98_PANMI|nr:hypothetical protein C2845_PM07G02820 [Panicum miliaceum]